MSRQSAFASIAQLNAMLLRPFRERVDLGTVFLALALALVASGMWHLVLERIDREVKEL